MANTTDKSILTAAGKALLAQLNAEEKPLIIDKMIFANVPNRPEFPQPDDVVPTDHVVHQEGVEQRGRLSADSVIYSTTLTSDVGPFEFNWTGAYCSEYGVLVTIDHHALTPKSADEPGVAGNTLVRSVVLEYKDIAEITNITVDASSWQYNATPRMKKMDDDVAQAIIDQNGKDWFIDDGFLVTPQASAFNIKAGAGYVSGNRVTLEFDRNVQVPNKPSFIYVDAHREGTPTGEQVTLFDFVVTAEEKDDYIDANGVKHFVCKIVQVLADGSVSDLRPEGESAGKSWVTQNHVPNEKSTLAITVKETGLARALKTNGYAVEGDGGAWDFIFTGSVIEGRAASSDYLASEFLIYDVNGREFSAVGKPSLKRIGCKNGADISDLLIKLGSRVIKTYIDVDGGDYQISKLCEFSSDINWNVTSDTKITATQEMQAGLVFSGEPEVYGSKLDLDMAKLDYGCGICSRNHLPKFTNVNVFNVNGPTVIRSVELPEIIDGKLIRGSTGPLQNDYGYLRRHNYDRADYGPHIYGARDPAADAGSFWRFVGEFEFVGMVSSPSCGSQGSLYFASDLRKVTRDGGTFEGAPTTGSNCYTCDTVHEKGGIFLNINRGPTVGKNCRNYKITNWIAIGCSYAGASVDLRDDGNPPETEEYPLGYGVVSGGVTRECGYMLFVNGKATSISNNTSYDHKDKNSGAIRINGGGKVWVDGNSCWGCGDNPWISAGNGTTLQLGVNNHDSTNNVPIRTSDGQNSLIQDRLIQIVDARTKATYADASDRDTHYQANLNQLNHGMVVKVGSVFYEWEGESSPGSYDSSLFKQESNYDVSVSSDVDIVRIDSQEIPVRLRFPDMDYANIRTEWKILRRNGQSPIEFLVANGDGGFFGGREMDGTVRFASVMASSFKEYLSSLPA
ncbi:phage tail protein [Vibrio splendidus]|uniref:phage tail-collar fiber domain-containing protein n=1 Tax=Vibrio splendidus TaxID=29497 RepID=UPI0024684873|nr:phage tail protein [Vibrio splendidus]MDH5915072.1 phage tail protein [Vibrio splendidus]